MIREIDPVVSLAMQPRQVDFRRTTRGKIGACHPKRGINQITTIDVRFSSGKLHIFVADNAHLVFAKSRPTTMIRRLHGN